MHTTQCHGYTYIPVDVGKIGINVEVGVVVVRLQKSVGITAAVLVLYTGCKNIENTQPMILSVSNTHALYTQHVISVSADLP